MSSAFILALLGKFWPFILAAIGAGVAILKAYRAGAAKERNKQNAAEAKARTVADEVDSDVGALPPDEARKELGKWSRD